jgi:polyphosphate kinase 2 (PPK2 family)
MYLAILIPSAMMQSFKSTNCLELSHDFLWRIRQHAPAKGIIYIFNRSHYEDVIVTQVHKIIPDEWCISE